MHQRPSAPEWLGDDGITYTTADIDPALALLEAPKRIVRLEVKQSVSHHSHLYSIRVSGPLCVDLAGPGQSLPCSSVPAGTGTSRVTSTGDASSPSKDAFSA